MHSKSIEALARHGHDADVHRWIDSYADRLEERPRGIQPIAPEEWRDPLGDPVRTGDWLDFFARALDRQPWRDVLAGGRACCRASRRDYQAHASGPGRATDPRAALDAVPRVPDQRFGIRARLAQLADLPGWAAAAGAVPGDETQNIPDRLASIVDPAVLRHGTHGHGNPVMLVHAATAPNAALRCLPALPGRLWPASLAAAWAASAAVTSASAPPDAQPEPRAAGSQYLDDFMARSTAAGDPHAIKFVDTAADAYGRCTDEGIIAAAANAIDLIEAG